MEAERAERDAAPSPTRSMGRGAGTVVQRKMQVGAAADAAERDADRVAGEVLSALRSGTPGAEPASRIRRAATPAATEAGHVRRLVIRRTYVNGSAEKDAPLFSKEPPVKAPELKVGPGSQAAKFGITEGNLEHYLERHTFKYQRLNAKTVSPGAGMFPHGTDAAGVAALLDEALAALPDGTPIGESPVSVPVDLKNGLRVNLGALKGGKLAAFFPVAGGTHKGFNFYESDELKAIRDAKNAAGAKQ